MTQWIIIDLNLTHYNVVAKASPKCISDNYYTLWILVKNDTYLLSEWLSILSKDWLEYDYFSADKNGNLYTQELLRKEDMNTWETLCGNTKRHVLSNCYLAQGIHLIKQNVMAACHFKKRKKEINRAGFTLQFLIQYGFFQYSCRQIQMQSVN